MRFLQPVLIWLPLSLVALSLVALSLPGGTRCACAEEAPVGARAFVETRADIARPFVGQAVELRLRFGLDAAWFDAHAVQLFRRPMDLPVQISVPWAAALDGLRDISASSGQPEGPRFVRDDVEARARRAAAEERSGRTFRVYEWVRTVVPMRAGPLLLPGPTLRFAYATSFEDDFVGGRVALDRKDARVQAQELALEVRPLPEAGQPPGFRGAVGVFHLHATVDESLFAATGTVRVKVVVTGTGSLRTVEAPPFPMEAGFHVVGVIDGRAGDDRLITYEVAPLSARVTSVPPITLPYFDPTGAGAYRLARTEAVPLTVRANAELPAQDPPSAPVSSGGASKQDEPSALMWLVLLALSAGIAWLLLRARGAEEEEGLVEIEEAAVVAEQERQHALGLRRQAARDDARAACDTPAAVDRLVALLACHFEVPPAAIIGPELAGRLRRAGVDAALAARISDLVEKDVASRYGSAGTGARVEESLVDELYAALVGP